METEAPIATWRGIELKTPQRQFMRVGDGTIGPRIGASMRAPSSARGWASMLAVQATYSSNAHENGVPFLFLRAASEGEYMRLSLPKTSISSTTTLPVSRRTWRGAPAGDCCSGMTAHPDVILGLARRANIRPPICEA